MINSQAILFIRCFQVIIFSYCVIRITMINLRRKAKCKRERTFIGLEKREADIIFSCWFCIVFVVIGFLLTFN